MACRERSRSGSNEHHSIKNTIKKEPEALIESIHYQNDLDKNKFECNNTQSKATAEKSTSKNEEAEDSNSPFLPEPLQHHPLHWSRDDVKIWLKWCVEQFQLSESILHDAPFLMNGKAILLLGKDDFEKRIPGYGDVLYNSLQTLISLQLNHQSQSDKDSLIGRKNHLTSAKFPEYHSAFIGESAIYPSVGLEHNPFTFAQELNFPSSPILPFDPRFSHLIPELQRKLHLSQGIHNSNRSEGSSSQDNRQSSSDGNNVHHSSYQYQRIFQNLSPSLIGNSEQEENVSPSSSEKLTNEEDQKMDDHHQSYVRKYPPISEAIRLSVQKRGHENYELGDGQDVKRQKQNREQKNTPDLGEGDTTQVTVNTPQEENSSDLNFNLTGWRNSFINKQSESENNSQAETQDSITDSKESKLYQTQSQPASPLINNENNSVSYEEVSESSNYCLLWDFLRRVLQENRYPDCIQWCNKENFTFKIINPEGLARLWGAQKNRTNMTYEKMSRALRYYYRSGIMRKVPQQKLIYQFLIDPNCIPRLPRGVRLTMNEKNGSMSSKYSSSATINSAEMDHAAYDRHNGWSRNNHSKSNRHNLTSQKSLFTAQINNQRKQQQKQREETLTVTRGNEVRAVSDLTKSKKGACSSSLSTKSSWRSNIGLQLGSDSSREDFLLQSQQESPLINAYYPSTQLQQLMKITNGDNLKTHATGSVHIDDDDCDEKSSSNHELSLRAEHINDYINAAIKTHDEHDDDDESDIMPNFAMYNSLSKSVSDTAIDLTINVSSSTNSTVIHEERAHSS